MANYTMDTYTDLMVGGMFLKEKIITDKYLEIKYCNTYSEYKQLKPEANISEEQFNDYFNSGDKVLKILVIEPIRLLRQFPTLDRIGMELKDYRFIADRVSLNNLLGVKIEDLSVDDGSWITFINNNIFNRKEIPKLFKEIQKFSNEIIRISEEKGISLIEQLNWINKEMSLDRIIVKNDGSIHYVDRLLTNEERQQNKLLLYFIQGAVTALGSRTMNSLMDSQISGYIQEVILGLFK